MQHEYAFDVKLFAVVRVRAETVEKAVEAMRVVIDCADVDYTSVDLPETVQITEVSLAESGEEENEVPFEIDGEPV